MKKFLLALLLLGCLVTPAYAGFKAEQWHYYKSFKAGSEGLTRVELDNEVLRHACSGLVDLRVLDENGKEVPYLLSPGQSAAEPQITAVEAKMVDNIILPDGSSRVTLDLMKSNLISNRIDLEIAKHEDYVCEVIVEGSDDNQDWARLTRSKIFQIQPEHRNNQINYPESTFRYLRLTLGPAGKEPLKVNGVFVWLAPEERKINTAIKARIDKRYENVKKGQTVLVIDLGVKDCYVDRIHIDFTEQNFARTYTVNQSLNQQRWEPITGGTITRYSGKINRINESDIKIRSLAHRYLQVIIDNGDSPPLDMRSFKVFGEKPSLIADIKPGTYHLWYGNALASQPQYDLTHFYPIIRDRETLPAVKLGPEQANPDYSPPRTPWLINMIVLVTAAVLIAVIVKNLRGIAK